MTLTGSITSPDGEWAWDGVTWQPVVEAPGDVPSEPGLAGPAPVPTVGNVVGRPARTGRRREVMAGVALTVLVGAGFLVAATVGHSGQVPAASQAVTILPTGDQGASPNEKCSTDVYDAAADMANNGQDGGVRELQVGGAYNPVYTLGIRVEQQYAVDLDSVGRLQATTNANAMASRLCADNGNPNQDKFGGPPYTPGDASTTDDTSSVGSNTTEVTVPDVTGEGFCDAQQALESAGLSVSQTSAGQCSDTVTSEDPSGGSTVDQGTAIDLGTG